MSLIYIYIPLGGARLSPDREVTIERIAILSLLYTIYSGGSASEELSRRPQFSLKNELNIACKKSFVPPPGVTQKV